MMLNLMGDAARPVTLPKPRAQKGPGRRLVFPIFQLLREAGGGGALNESAGWSGSLGGEQA